MCFICIYHAYESNLVKIATQGFGRSISVEYVNQRKWDKPHKPFQNILSIVLNDNVYPVIYDFKA